MANIPTPRSYNQVLSDMLDAFLSRFGIDRVKPGSPILSILEAAAQSDVRATNDIFSYLNSVNLDRATGDAVDKIGADEDLPRLGQSFGTGVVTISDSSFSKLITKLDVGYPAPIVGSLTIHLVDASLFPTSGNIYIGRGTVNYEGPLAYTRSGNVLTLSNATQNFHNTQEPVVLAQGGNRTVSAGTIIQTAQGNATTAVRFSTLYSVVVPDGETEITGVTVVASKPGLSGRINATAIQSFITAPFAGATVTNPLPFTNARPTENEINYKGRIRTARKTRAKGTSLAITSGVLGILAADENKTVLSASVVSRENFPAVLYIDDGTGYEERTSGVSIEGVVDDAQGGEQYFEVTNRPVAKAFLESSVTEPFTLEAGAVLAVKVNGLLYKHTFSVDNFRNIGNASAYEVVSSINSDPALPFNARLSGNGDTFSIVADTDTQENLEAWPADADEIDANQWFGLSIGRVETMLLYKNDRLLSKDGRTAIITSQPLADWGRITSPATLILAIDNTPEVTYEFTSQDFVDQHTGYATLAASNGVDAWATVFNARLPGVTASRAGSSLVLVSNLDNDDRSRLTVTGGTLVSTGMFVVADSEGAANDYTLNRNTGQLRLEESLEEEDVLAIGTVNTRAFIQSASIPTIASITSAESWWVVDGQATIIPSTVVAGTVITFLHVNPSSGAPAWGKRIRVSTIANTTPFNEIQMGDWAIFNDTALDPDNKGAWRVSYVDTAGVYFEIERPAGGYVEESPTLSTGGLTFVRTLEPVQLVTIPTDTNYTANSLADVFFLRGATAYVSRTTRLRVRTNNFGNDGDIALVAQDAESAKMLMTVGDYVANLTSHLGTITAESSEVGNPEFVVSSIDTVASSTVFDRIAVDPLATSGHQLAWIKPLPDVDNTTSLNYTNLTTAWAVAEVVTGGTSGTTGTIGSILGGAPGDVEGTIVLTGVAGTGFVAGEVLTGSVDGLALALANTTIWKDRWSNYNQHTGITTRSGVTTTVRNPLERLPSAKFYAAAPFAIGPQDDFTVVIDEDQQLQRYSMPMYRKGLATTTTYGATNLVKDANNSNGSLALGFGLAYDWTDYAVWMKARAKTHNEAGDTTKTVLYRYNRFGQEGNQVYVRYIYPTAAGQSIAVTTDNLLDGQTQVYVSVPSGSARTGVTVRNSTKMGVIVTTGPDTLNTITYILGYSETTANTVVKLRVQLPQTGTGNFAPGDVVTGGTSGAVATVAGVDYAEAGYGFITWTGTPVGGTFVDGETLSSPTGGAHTGTADGDQYGLVTATLNIATPGATDHGFQSTILEVADTSNFFVGDTIRGTTTNSLAVVTDTTGTTITLQDVSGAFDIGEALVATSIGITGQSVVSVADGDVIFVTSTSGSFASGAKNIVGRTASTIQYVESNAAIAPTATPGRVSFDVGLTTTIGSTVVSGDLFNLASDADHVAAYKRTIRIAALGNQYWSGPADGSVGLTTFPVWESINQAVNLSFFPVATGSAKASDYATAVNSLAAAGTSPITAVAMGLASVTTGVISQASYDEFSATSDKHYELSDGINWIRSQVEPGNTSINYTFTFKDAVTATLATNSDWANEDLRLVPTTTKNIVDWFNAQAVSGLSSVAEAATSADGNKPQITTLLSGRIGGVHVQGGSANSLDASVFGASSMIASTYALATVKASDVVGLSGGQWVAIQNYNAVPKIVFTSATVIGSIASTGVVTLHASSPTYAWTWANSGAAALNTFRWQIEKQGKYVSYSWDGIGSAPVLTGVSEGDWVIISDSPTATVNTRNQGTFRIVRCDTTNHVFWIENTNALEERNLINLSFLTYDSIMAGDQLLINTSIFGADNVGVWTVDTINMANRKEFTLVLDKELTSFSGPHTLGTVYPLIQVLEGSPTRLIKKVRTIAPNVEDSTYLDIKFETSVGYRQISESAGSIIRSLDKLSFPTDLVQGVDGYRYSTGLIREANRVVYGDPSDPSSYPGIIAAGAKVNIEGALVKRITCALGLRLKTGVGENDVKVRVRSAVASVINDTDVGASIAIDDLIGAAKSVPGVAAVTWLSPDYSAGHDLISVQPFEKPLVLNLDSDIRISLVSK